MSESLECEIHRRAHHLYHSAHKLGLVANKEMSAVWVADGAAIQYNYRTMMIWVSGRLVYHRSPRDSSKQIRDLEDCQKIVQTFRRLMVLDELANV